MRKCKHGLYTHPLYRVFHHIQQRCYKKNCKEYPNYGGRGITCEWKNLTDFIRDMYPSYSHGLQIDRKDNNGSYSKDNCRWITQKLNSNNKRTNILFKGKSIALWCDELSLNRNTIYSRIYRGWSIEKALTHNPLQT